MSGSSIGFTQHTFANARIAGEARYTPSYIKQGEQKPISQRAEFGIFVNDRNGKACVFRMTAWGGLADSIAKHAPSGKEVTIIADATSYESRVTYQDAAGNMQFVTNPATGQPLTTTKVGFVVRQILYGNDSEKWIQNEIAAGLRPQFWNVPGHQDAVTWSNECKRRNAEQFQYGMNKFGFAKVAQIPQGAQYAPPQNSGNAQVQNVGNPNVVAQNMGAPNPAAGMSNNPGNTGYAQNPAAGMNTNPVTVNGQNMGYPMQNQNAGSAPAAPNTGGNMAANPNAAPAVMM